MVTKYKMYTLSELKEQFPKAFQKAFQNHYTQTWNFWSDFENDLDYYFREALNKYIGEDYENNLIRWNINDRPIDSSGVNYIEFDLDFLNSYYLTLFRESGASEESYQLLIKVLEVSDVEYEYDTQDGYSVYFYHHSNYILSLLMGEMDEEQLDNFDITEEDIDKLEKEFNVLLGGILYSIDNDLVNNINNHLEWRNSEERTIEASEANDELYFEDGKEVE